MTRNDRLCSHDELPEWAKDNAFIVKGYRRPGLGSEDGNASHEDDEVVAVPLHEERTGEVRRRKTNAKQQQINGNSSDVFRHDTLAKCWASIWSYAHNESVNIHSHLWGAVSSFIILGLHAAYHFNALPRSLDALAHAPIFRPSAILITVTTTPSDWKDIAGFTVFLLAAVTCLVLSSSFHTLSCHSRTLAKRFNALDYVGIVVMIVGSFLPALHYGFYRHPNWQLFYALAITTLGAFAAWAVLTPRYATPEYRPVRTAIFLALGLSAVIPVAHGWAIYGYQTLRLTMGLDFLVLSGSLYVAGALTYACRVPERFARGKFDYIGASHQLFHVAIVCAAFSHYVCLRRAYAYWHSSFAMP